MNDITRYQFKNPTQIACVVNGETNPLICSMPALLDRKEAIKQKYSKINYINNHPDVNQIHLQCLRLNFDEIIRIIGVSTAIGIVGGSLIGGVWKGLNGALIGGASGGAVGICAGALISFHKELYINKPYIIEYVSKETEFSAFKQRKTQEEYKYFVGFFRNYIEGHRQDEELKMEDFLCCLTYNLPEFPVFSVHDTKRRHVYEKSVIEQHIDSVEEKVSIFIETNSGYLTDDEIQRQANKIRINSDPFHEHPIAKSDLVYDPLFVKNIIGKLTGILKELIKTTKTEDDRVILQGVQSLIAHYKAQYTQVNYGLINQFRDDVFQMKGNYQLATIAAEQLKKEFQKV